MSVNKLSDLTHLCTFLANKGRMILNYIKIGYRSLMRNRLVSFINIFGLGLSMSVGMMEMVIIQDALSYDRFHPFPDRTYRVISNYNKKTGEQWKLASSPFPLYNSLKADTAEIEDAVNLYPAFNGTAHWGGKELGLNGAFTEPSFFNIFGFRLASGNPATALKDPSGIVLSKATAEKFFGNADPMGKVIALDHKGSFVVTGVLADPPGKSQIGYDAYASATAIPQLVLNRQFPDRAMDWGDCRVAYTYVLMKKQAGVNMLGGQVNAIAAAINRTDKNGRLSFITQPIEKIRPGDSDIYNDTGGGTTWTKLWTGIIVALLVLFAACFNYTNLTVARALTRAKEVGIRKIVGARRYQIFLQYITESVVQAFLAL